MNVQELAQAAQNLSFEQRKELIKTLIAQLPKSESLGGSVELVDDLETVAQESREQVNASIPNLNWLKAHRVEYAGQWVALHDGELIAHSRDGESLIAPVRQSRVRNPMIVYVEPPGNEIFVGF